MSPRMARFRKLLNPYFVAAFLVSYFYPKLLWNSYIKACKRIGLRRGVFVLSFDCDTELDIEVIPEVYRKLKNLGIRPVFAVPGELIIAGGAVYKRLADDGAEFINHGYKKHTDLKLPDRIYESYFFYETLTTPEVESDIRSGDEVIRDYLGLTPKGFRTPHFGTYQSKKNLAFLHKTLKELGYKFSTSTTPFYGFRNGPLSIHDSVIELPVSGCPSWPLRILDSWGFAFNPQRIVSKADYIQELSALTDLLESKDPVFINIYADPSQIYDWPEFFEAMKRLARFNAHSFESAIGILQP